MNAAAITTQTLARAQVWLDVGPYPAANLARELVALYPGVKFRVSCARALTGPVVRVAWTDGPTVGQLDMLADRYRLPGEWSQRFGRAAYVVLERRDSPQALASAERTLRAQGRPLDRWSVRAVAAGRTWALPRRAP